MSSLTNSQKSEIVRLYQMNSARKTAEIFNNHYPDRIPPLNYSTVVKINKKVISAGSGGNNNNPKPGRPSKTQNENYVLETLGRIAANPKISTRALSREVQLSRATVSKILKDHKNHPYKAQFHNKFYGVDRQSRMDFCVAFRDRVEGDPTLLRRILWSDECLFKLSGSFNRQNNR